ncbi:MAG: AfsR/SARP family transcriptional regulator, partial [Candidatus Longimicrobiales bacterium M2_2A_002]
MSTFHVRLLGGFAIESPSTKASPSLSQRRPEAVLAVLAVCGDLGCTRERVIGLLWPERDEATARHNLRDALYAIRKVLGREAITGTGDMLHLDPDVVSTDVQQFRAALRDDRLADAVALYGGPLLDGFHPGDALEFERWLEDARARLFRERQDAVKELARRAEGTGRWDEAARWWARAVAADPYDTRLVAQRVIALARSGDRANAVLEGEAHVQRLRTDLDLDPGDPFLEELGRVRSGEISAAVPPSGPAAGAARAPARHRPAERTREPDGPPVAGHDPDSTGRGAGPRSRYGLLRWGVVGAGIGLMLAATILVARWGATASPDPGLVDPV